MINNKKARNKITILLPNLNGGGAEHVNLLLLQGFINLGYQVDLVLFNRTGEFLSRVPAGVNLIAPVSRKNKYFSIFIAFLNLIKSGRKSDILLAGLELSPTYLVCFAKILLGKPAIAWLHVDLLQYLPRLKKIHRLLIKNVYPRFDKIVAVSNGVQESLLQVTSTKKENVTVIYNISKVFLDDKRSGFYSPNDVFFKNKFVLSVGRLVEQKGFDFLIESFYQFSKSNSNVNLVILGDGPLKEQLTNRLIALNLQDRVRLVGFVSNVAWFYQHCWLLVHPARFEGLGMVLIEAMSFGKPVISTDCPSGPREVLANGTFGVLFPVGNTEHLIQSLYDMTNDDVYMRYSILSKMRSNEFSEETIMPQWMKLIEELDKNA